MTKNSLTQVEQLDQFIELLKQARKALDTDDAKMESFNTEAFKNYSDDVLDRSIKILDCHQTLPGPLRNVLNSLKYAKLNRQAENKSLLAQHNQALFGARKWNGKS